MYYSFQIASYGLQKLCHVFLPHHNMALKFPNKKSCHLTLQVYDDTNINKEIKTFYICFQFLLDILPIRFELYPVLTCGVITQIVLSNFYVLLYSWFRAS
jgi:hypothetical protein